MSSPAQCERDECNTPDEGKKRDCCDEECLDVLARRSCVEDGCDTLGGDEAFPSKDSECANDTDKQGSDSCCGGETHEKISVEGSGCKARTVSSVYSASISTGDNCCGKVAKSPAHGSIESKCRDKTSTKSPGINKNENQTSSSCCGSYESNVVEKSATALSQTHIDARLQPTCSSSGVEASRNAASSVTCRRSNESGEKPSCTTPKQPRPKKTSACKKHLNETRQKFGETLEALGCICRALLARNVESCCTSSSRPSSLRPKLASSTSSVTPGRSPVRRDSREQARPSDAATRVKDSCCSAGKCSSTSKDGSNTRRRSSNDRQVSADNGPVTKSEGTRGCCSSVATKPIKVPLKKSCCETQSDDIISCCAEDEKKSAFSESVDECCDSGTGKCGSKPIEKDSCCGDEKDSKNSHNLAIVKSKDINMDIEKSFPQVTEHVVLSVEGMTCVGCEKKLFRSLDLLPQIHNLKTSLVMSQAEFELNTASSTVEEIIRILERSTEFVYQKLSTAGQYLDLIPSGNVDQFITGISEQYGVLATSKLNSGIVRVEYNPRVVGARDLMSNCDDTAIRLAPVQANSAVAAGNRHVRHTGWMTLFSAILTIPVLILAWAPLPEHALAYGITSLILASVVQTVVAGPFYPSAIKSLIFTRVIEMDLLIVLSTTTAYIFSIVSFAYETAGNPLPTGQFFETSTLLVTLIMLGRYISALARQRAVESISVRSLQEHTALLVKSDGFTTESIDARLLQYGDIFKIIPESRITTDGIVINGHSEVDESMITGESKPIEKLGGSQVVAGSVNISGALTIQLTRLPDENTISEIADLVDKAKFSKPKVQDMADRIASYFVPVVIVLSIITFSIWMAVSIAIRGERASVAAVNSITYAIAVLIVSCPCAIGLAIPMVVVISGGVGAKHGVIFKSSEMIEVARKVDHVIFDKTGTLTEGKMSVIEEDYFDFSKELVTRLALGMTGDIQHPVSAAVAKHLIDQDVKPELLYDLKTLPGKGIEGTWNGELIRAGNSRWLSLQSHPAVQSLLSQSLSAFCITMNDRLIGIYGLQDQLRSDALDVVTALKARNISVHIVSGDDQGAVQAIASELDIPAMNVQSKSTPSQKAEYIKSLSPAVTLFVGDGTNDAPALASASVGVHISSDTATSIAESAADIILVRPVLHGVIILLNLSKASYQRIMFNFGWAFVYNLFAILLAAGAFVGARIPPAYAGLGEIVSVLPVVAAAWALKWVKL